jgi:chemotaxis protein histidine kinase CheA
VGGGAVSGAKDVEMERRMAELGQRYLERTTGELDELRGLVAKIPEGAEGTYKAIEVLSHRIRGSGAMFGFDLVSDVAGEIELLAVDAKLGLLPDRIAVQMRFAALLRVMNFVLTAARSNS